MNKATGSSEHKKKHQKSIDFLKNFLNKHLLENQCQKNQGPQTLTHDSFFLGGYYEV
jgi:hypothetical protein